MAGGVTFFQQEADLLGLATCLTLMVIFTVILEYLIEELKERLEVSPTGLKIFQKLSTELMILGFISFSLVFVVEFALDNAFIAKYLAEFEVAHLWMFFVGGMYIVTTIFFYSYLVYVKRKWHELYCKPFDAVVDLYQAEDLGDIRVDSNEGIELAEKSPVSTNKITRSNTQILNGRKSQHNVKSLSPTKWRGLRKATWKSRLFGDYGEAEFKVVHLFFLRQHWDRIKQELPDMAVPAFDYSQYIKTIVSLELKVLLEVHPLTWGVFISVFWIIIVGQTIDYAIEQVHSESLVIVNICLGWLLFFLALALLMQSHRGMRRLHVAIGKCFGLSNVSNVEELFEKLVNNGEFDAINMEQTLNIGTNAVGQQKNPRNPKSPTSGRRATASTPTPGPRGSMINFTPPAGFVPVKRRDFRKIMRFSPLVMSRFSGLIMFFQCFMLGMVFLINSKELFNNSRHYGAKIDDYNKKDDNNTSYVKVDDGAHRVLGAAPAAYGGGKDWRRCEEYVSYEANKVEGKPWKVGYFKGGGDYTRDGKYKCRVYSTWFQVIGFILMVTPQALVLFWLQPSYIKNYCYYAAVMMGETGADSAEHHEEDEKLAGILATKQGHSRGHSEGHSEGHGEHGHGGEHAGGHHVAHMGAQEYSDIIQDVLEKMSQDHTLAVLIRSKTNDIIKRMMKETADECVMYSLEERREQAARARDRLFESMDLDHSGKLSYTELKTAFKVMFKQYAMEPLTRSEFTRMIRMLDPDGDRKIDKSEFIAFMNGGREDEIALNNMLENFNNDSDGDTTSRLEQENAMLKKKIRALEAKSREDAEALQALQALQQENATQETAETAETAETEEHMGSVNVQIGEK